ncbi:MAG: DUF294 nucleotidyltransferase-like domain-containing protein [Phycisphaerae bacterium]|jgi:hypothetical protein
MLTAVDWLQRRDEMFTDVFRRPADILHSLQYAKQISQLYDQVVADIGRALAGDAMHGYCICAFGSPARFEMLGQSDLDCLIVRTDDVDVSSFRDSFILALRERGFSKIDIPEWGALSDCEAFMATAVTEGNQIVEARYIAGDATVWRKLLALKRRYCTPERFRVTFLFQYYYFQQYYAQRERVGQRNLKYGHGGTRDFLFPTWLANLRDGFAACHDQESPHIVTSLQSLRNHDDLSCDGLGPALDAVNVVAFLRNELLRHSEGTSDSGLTYLHTESAHAIASHLPHLYGSHAEVVTHGTAAANHVAALKRICLAGFMRDREIERRTTRQDPADELGAIALSWSRDLSGCPGSLFTKLLSGSRWTVLASLACNHTCPPGALDDLARLGMRKGYEYILKVVGRNPRTADATLERIAACQAEWRFREPAVTRLEQGWRRANEL